MQRVLKKHLPNTLMLTVDHLANTYNYDFYNNEVRFVDKKLVLVDLTNHTNSINLA